MIELYERSPWRPVEMLLLIGPGGTGKSSLGAQLAPLLNRRLIDLDDEFRCRLGDISAFTAVKGVEEYKTRNSLLAMEIVTEAVSPALLVTSSGFLTPDNPKSALEANRKLLRACYSVCLLPSRDLERSVKVIVERQLRRPFGRGRRGEEAAIQTRYPVYAALGDLVVFSTAGVSDIAREVARHLTQRE